MRLRPAFAGFVDASSASLDAGEKAIISERPANALGGAQTSEQIGLRFAGKQIGKVGKAISDGCQSGDTIVSTAQMRARARPPPILSTIDQPRPHRVERHIAQRRGEMLLVHGDGAEPALPEMTAALAPRLDDTVIAAVPPAQGRDATRRDRSVRG